MSDTVVIQPNNENNADFGKYQFISELGDGAMGTVYKCFDPDFHRMVAVKTVHKALLTDNASDEFRERFRNEMRATGKLAHPNIVSVFDAGEKDNCPFYVMEFVEGHDLKHVLEAGEPISLKRALLIVKGVLRGLSSIHKHGITHRDLKPANIFVSSDGVAKIADFGIAKLDNSDMTQIGTVIGSPKYMSPEQCVGEVVDPRTDLFATGIILYELLTGTYCFKGSSTSAVTQKIINVDIVPPSKIDKSIPRYLDKVLKKALSKNANDRFQNALDFLNALDGKESKVEKTQNKYKVAAAGCALFTVIAVMIFYVFSSYSLRPTDKAAENKTEILKIIPDKTPTKVTIQTLSPSLSPTDKAAENKTEIFQTIPNKTPTKVTIQTLSPKKAAKVAKLFKVAETYKRIGRLVSPAGSNAFDAYKIVLSIDPENEKALEGLDSVKRALVSQAEKFVQSGEVAQAVLVARAGEEVFPGSVIFTDILNELKSN